MSQFGTAFIRAIGNTLAIDGMAPEVGFVEGGYLFLATPAGQAVLESNHRIQSDLGADVALLSVPALAQRFAWLATTDLAAGSLGLSGEGWLDAYALLQALRRKAIALGVTYRQARVAGLTLEGGRVSEVLLDDGSRVGCDALINAAGTGATALAHAAGIDLPVESRKRCVFHFASPASLPGCPLLIDPGGAWFRPEGSGFITGIAPAPADDAQCFDFEVVDDLFDQVLWPVLAARVPQFEALRLQRAWAGHYDVNTLDHNVILGAHPEVANLLFANGFSGHGLQHSPAAGRALAELVIHGAYRTLDLAGFGWQRVLENRPLREINVV